MAKYRIFGGRYGGEVAIGKVSHEFAEYWAPRIEDEGDSDCIEFVTSVEWDDEPSDTESPAMTLEGNRPWYELDDIEHINSYSADGGFRVVKVDDDDKEDWNTEVEIEGYHQLYGREAYHDVEFPEPTEYITEEDIENYVPVMTFHSFEKGQFGTWEVEIDGEFDPDKFAYSIVETMVGEFVDKVFYDKKELEQNFDWADSTGKGYYAKVGWMNPKYHDKSEVYTDEYLVDNGFWEDLEDSIAYDKEQAEENND